MRKRLFSCVMALLVIVTLVPVNCSAAEDHSNDVNNLSGPYVGYSSIDDLEAKYLSGTSLTSLNFSYEQCVTYAWYRMKEKLFGYNVDTGLSGGTGDGKDVARSFVNQGYGEYGTSPYRTLYAKNGTAYRVTAYTNDGGSHIVSNSFVCFNHESNHTSNVAYGHVVFVEEVVVINGVKYVYYTEGGAGYTKWEPRRQTFAEFYNNGNGYTGTVTFTLACEHDTNYTSKGRCGKCGAWLPFKDYGVSFDGVTLKRGYYKVPKGKTAYMRVHPYKASNSDIGELLFTLKSGESVEVERVIVNGLDNRWYKVSYKGNTGYIFSDNLTYEPRSCPPVR